MIKLVYPTIVKEEQTAVASVLKSLHLERGDVTLKLEEELCQKFNSRHSVVTANGTAALFVGLSAAGIGEGDEVITSPLSFIATVNVILLCNATPVFVDIDPETFNIDTSLIEAKITKKTKAILAVDLYGHPAEYKKLRELADKYKLLLISDSCQAMGATYKKKTINHFADITVFSFFNSKNIIAGEGGALLTDDTQISDKVNRLINHGQKRGEKYNFIDVGWNFRPTDIQSAIIRTQLKKLETINSKRHENAMFFINQLSQIKGIVCPKSRSDVLHAYSRFTIMVTEQFPLSRQELKEYLHKNDIETEIAYPKPLYEYSHLNCYKLEPLPVVEDIVDRILSLPIHQNLSKNDVAHIINVFKNIIK